MPPLQEKICLIIPCYNEARRIRLDTFEAASREIFFLFVNDGSRDDTADILRRGIARNANMFILDLQKNVGKAEAVRQGMLHLKRLPVFKRITWVGYWDADLATPLSEVPHFYGYAKLYGQEIDAIWGSRVSRLGSSIIRSHLRHFLGRAFATIIGFTLKVKSYDSQCGAKLFKKELIDPAFSRKFISKWIFDVEILLRLKKYKILEYPLRVWNDVRGSKIRIFSVALGTLVNIMVIAGHYRESR